MVVCPAVGITGAISSRGRRHGRGFLRGNEIRRENGCGDHLLLQTTPAIPAARRPSHTTGVIIIPRAGFGRGFSGALKFGDDSVVGRGHKDRDEGQPGGRHALEEDFVVVASFVGFAESFGHDVAAVLGGEEVAQGDLDEARYGV